MKATTLIIAAVLSLQINFLFAGNKGFKSISNSELANSGMISLAPATPASADFSDVVPDPESGFSSLAPITPAEAEFNDMVPDMNTINNDLAPVTPSFADFDENNNDQSATISLNPVTPAEADFE